MTCFCERVHFLYLIWSCSTRSSFYLRDNCYYYRDDRYWTLACATQHKIQTSLTGANISDEENEIANCRSFNERRIEHSWVLIWSRKLVGVADRMANTAWYLSEKIISWYKPLTAVRRGGYSERNVSSCLTCWMLKWKLEVKIRRQAPGTQGISYSPSEFS